ncbi:MAG: FAD-dependent oxidoreductase [Candidatus Rokuibacteriota bacterium]|nr:MAG: FAD-dependent oxidoreductase [Candidatus Rokubacteria bacterium]
MRIRSEAGVVVCGGGTAGAIAAIAAARTGARSLLIDQYGTVGGMASTGMSFLGVSDAGGRRALGGIGGELFARLVAVGAAFEDRPDGQVGSVTAADPFALQQVLLAMLVESGVDFLLHTFCVDALVDGGRVRGVLVANKGGLEIVPGRAFVDATGDGDIAARGGARFVMGRRADRLMQPVTRIFRVADVDVGAMLAFLRAHPEEMSLPERWQGGAAYGHEDLENPSVVMDAFPALVAEARASGELTVPRDRIGIETGPVPGVVTINATRVHGIDGTDPDALSRAEIETQRQMFELFRFLRRRVPGFARARLLGSSYQVGVRETRHILGEYVLTLDDVLSGRDFADTVGRGAYPVDLHDVGEGAEVLGDRVGGGGVTLRRIERAYGIPVRCLLPAGMDGLVVAGRAISATHEAGGSVRGQAVCMATGHAAGTLAGLASQRDGLPRQVPVEEVQALLERQGAILFHPERAPGSDTARAARTG